MREALRKLREYFWVLDTVPRFGEKTVVKLFEQGRSLQHIATLYDFDEKEEMATLKTGVAPVCQHCAETTARKLSQTEQPVIEYLLSSFSHTSVIAISVSVKI